MTFTDQLLAGPNEVNMVEYFKATDYRPGAKCIEKYSNTLQLLSLINDYNYITITGPVEM